MSAASGVAAPLSFRQDDDVVSGPAGISILMLLIAAVALLWIAGRGARRPSWLARVLANRTVTGAPDAAIEIAAQTQLGAGVRLHVVRWEGGRVLAAVNASGQVTVLQACSGGGTDGRMPAEGNGR